MQNRSPYHFFSSRLSLLKPALLIAAVITIGALYFLVDPAESKLLPKCLFHTLTGLQCPGCGSQRMLHALMHGDLSLAWRHNAFLLCLLPLLPPLVWLEFNRTRHSALYRRIYSMPAIITLTFALIIWSIARNIV